MLLDQLKELATLLRRASALEADPALAAHAPAGSGPERALDGATLTIIFSDAWWRILLVSRGAGAVAESRQGTLVDGGSLAAASGGSVDGLRAALRSLAPGERALIDAVELYPIDPEIEIFDNRAIRAFSADAAALRPIAENLTGTADCAFDSAPFTGAPGDRRLIAICRIELLRRYLAALGDLGPRLSCIAPEPLRRLAADAAAAPRAIAYLGARGTMFCVADPAGGVFAARATTTGVAAFAKLVADANSLPLAEAAEEMAERDMAARAVAAGMSAPLDALAALCRDTFGYVSDSRLADVPPLIELAGAVGAVHGLEGLLAERLGVAVAPLGLEPASAGHQAPAPLNLLRSAEGPIFSEGAREFVFENDRFVGRDIASRKDRSAKPKPQKAGAPPRKFAGIEIGGFAGEITPRRFAAMAAGAAGLAAFGIYDLAIAPAAGAVALSIARYQGEQTSAQALTDQVLKLRSAARSDALAAAGADKILWAEKFVSIGRALPTGLWLTAATIQSDVKRVGKVEVVATKLALVGVARSTGRRRLQEIAAFIEALEADAAFMRDFRTVSFAGLGGEGADAAFEVHAWYDENKRRKGASDDAASTNPLDAATDAAAARRRATPDPARGLGR